MLEIKKYVLGATSSASPTTLLLVFTVRSSSSPSPSPSASSTSPSLVNSLSDSPATTIRDPCVFQVQVPVFSIHSIHMPDAKSPTSKFNVVFQINEGNNAIIVE